jgi:hypothetical protein
VPREKGLAKQGKERTMRMHMRWVVVVMAVVFSLTAIAVAGGGPSTSQPVATFSVTATKSKEKQCVGTDGAYRGLKAEYTGTITSSEPRLNGNFKVRGDALVNVDEGSGITKGKMEVRDATTNKKTFKGHFDATNSSAGGGLLKGVIKGNFPGSRGMKLVANFTSEFDSPTHVNGELGGKDNTVGGSSEAETGNDPAVIQQGHC